MHKFKVKSLRNVHIFFSFTSENLFSALMSRKAANLSTGTKELIITLSESVKNKAELSRMLNIPRTTISRVVYYVENEPHFGLPLDFPHTNLGFLHTNLVPSCIYNEVDRFTKGPTI